MTSESNSDQQSLLGEDLKKNYNNRYFTTQPFNSVSDGFLAPVLPTEGIEEFFGPKVLTVLVLSRLYGWVGETFDWPPAKLAEQIARIKKLYSTWSEYKVHIYIDTSLIHLDGDYATKLGITSGAIESMCSDLSEYGFKYMGDLPESPDWKVFKDEFDAIYNIPPEQP